MSMAAHPAPAKRQAWSAYQPLLAPCLLLLLALPALWPYVQLGLPGTADGHLHLLRLVMLDYHVGQGMLYPRWVPELVLGYGYGVFHYYGPSSYYLALVFHAVGLSYVQALISTFVTFILMAGFGMYLLATDLFTGRGERQRRWFALVAAVAYLYSPYLLTNVYMRGAIAEVGAQALLPWIFWSFRRLLTDPKPARYLLPAALALGGLAITHTITLIFAPPILLLYLIVVWATDPASRQAAGRRLGWAVAGGVAAMGSSVFFWGPLLIERAYLADTAYEISARFIHENVWSWGNFLDWHWPFAYTLAIPFQLGALQLLLAVLGFILLRRRTPEWWYWTLLIPALGVAISQPLLPVWLSSETLLTAQFPWRLLTLMSVPLALLAPNLLGWLTRDRFVIAGALGLSLLVVLGQRPQLPADAEQFPSQVALGLPTVAQFELDTGAYGTGSASEYMPRWVKVLDTVVPPPDTIATPGQSLRLTDAGPYQWALTVNNPADAAVRFTRFYFPGWQATLDGATALSLEPTTLMGLLTAAVPAGEHTLAIRWHGTALQRWSALLSLFTLAVVTIVAGRQPGRRRLFALLPLALLLYGGVATSKPLPRAATFQQPRTAPTMPGLQLLGYYTQQPTAEQLYLFPTWAVDAAPADLRLHWRLLDAEGTVISEISVLPYFNTRHTTSWAPGAVAHDAYVLPLPAGLPAGAYTLQLGFAPLADAEAATGAEQPAVTVGEIALERVPLAQATPTHPLAAQWDHAILVDGYDLQVDGRQVLGSGADEAMGQGAYLVVKPGSRLTYTFYWRADQTPLENYHGFLHLLDSQQQALVQRDQLPGPMFSPPRLWNRFRAQTDSYGVTIPATATSGLYTPHVGLYEFASGARLNTFTVDGTPLGSSVALPPVKVVAETAANPQVELAVRVGDFAELIGYDLQLPTAPTLTQSAPVLSAGSQFTLTLYYRARETTPVNYTQFVQLYDGALGMAAQHDRMPQAGGNPTAAWVPGEVIIDHIPLHIATTSSPGAYTLQIGLYDAANGAVRIPLLDAAGQALRDAQLPLTKIMVSPCNGHC